MRACSTRAALVLITLSSIVSLAGCGGEASTPPELASSAQALIYTDVDTSNHQPGTGPKIVGLGVGAPGVNGGKYPGGFCFFVRLRGGFGGKGDAMTIDRDATNQWIIKASNDYSGTGGPAARTGCVLANHFKNVDPLLFSAMQVGAAEADGNTGVGTARAPEMFTFPVDDLLVFSDIRGQLWYGHYGRDQAQFTTSTFDPSTRLEGVAGTAFAQVSKGSGRSPYTAAGGFIFQNTGVPGIRYTRRDVPVLNDDSSGSVRNETALDVESRSFCFISGIQGDLHANDRVAEITGGNADGRWHLVVTGSNAGASATCVPYEQ